MKIALVNDVVYGYASRAPSAAGGAERYQWLLARALVAHGWSVVVGVRSGLESGTRVRIDGVDFVGLSTRQYLVAVYVFLSSERPDWCFWFGSTHLLGPLVALGWLTGTRSLFSAQFDLDVRPRQALFARRRFWALYFLGLAWSAKLFLQHRRQYAELPLRWRGKAHVIPGVVVVPDSFKAQPSRDRYVAWVGVLRQPKRPDLLIEIARRSPSTQFVVCGGVSATSHRSPSGYGERIADELKSTSNITYLGHVAPDRAVEIIGNASLLLTTSDAEGFPSVFLEAWAHGTPVVSLKVDPDQLIARKGLGVVSGGVDGAVRSIEALMNSVDERQMIGVRARQYVSDTHSGAVVAAVVERALRTASAPVLQPFESVQTQ